jgi:GrpB-like predicted nucleotidyltransferase (UPF0157 family)
VAEASDSGETKRVKVVPYDDDWPARFRREADALLAALGEVALGIEHIGSTSIPALAAKPTIDILIGIEHLDLPDSVLVAMQHLGYEYRGEMGVPGRRYFRKGPRYPRDFNVHMVIWHGPLWSSYVDFRDYLRDHPERAKEYAELKHQALAAPDGSLISNYGAAKEPFIAETLRRQRNKPGPPDG